MPELSICIYREKKIEVGLRVQHKVLYVFFSRIMERIESNIFIIDIDDIM